MPSEGSQSAVVLDLAEEFLERYRRGERPSLKEYIDRHPQLAGEIKDVFPAMAMMEHIALADESLEPPPLPPEVQAPLDQVGDYRIIRQVGRGGMGVVYEAEQVSLGRHVALKVLPQKMLLDERSKHRFQREAKAAAKLHHTNIVPVFGVGEHDGLPYYVMQFIQGQGLDKVLDELRRLRGSAQRDVLTTPEDSQAAAVALSLLTGAYPGPGLAAESPPPSSGSSSVSTSSLVLPGKPAGQPLSYWQSVARLGVQVAEALAHAHQQGVLHRDIKPSNLLLDAHGTVWVTDFGLAKADDQQDLTHTGDVLGTLRYIPPEAFDGKADARSDVYSLGLTLYELLALRPAFDEKDRPKLVKQVTTTEPGRLERLNPAVPRDLATIVHKAIAREPSQRYQTAGELAADLQRFVDDRPIQARRITVAERAWRWGRRNPLVAGLTTAVALFLVADALFATLSAFWFRAAADRERQLREDADKNAAEAQANLLTAQAEKERADREAAAAWENQYIAHASRMASDWDNADIGGILATLEIYRNPAPRKDVRGWEWYLYERLCHSELRTFSGHLYQVKSVAFSPDGTRLASASVDQTVKVWDVASGRVVLNLQGHTHQVLTVAFSPDGTRLASAGWDCTVKLIDAASGQELPTLKGHKDAVWSVAFSPEGTRLASGSSDGTVKVWDATTGQEVRTLEGARGPVAFSPDGTRLASAAGDEIKVWDVASGQELRTLKGPGGPVAFSPDGTRLASAGHDMTVRLWDVASGREIRALKGHKDSVSSLAFSPDGSLVASASSDRTVKLWDVGSGEELATLKGHRYSVESVAFSPDGTLLASASSDGTVKLWREAAGQGFRVLRPNKPPRKVNPPVVPGKPVVGYANPPPGVNSVAFSPDGGLLASGENDGTVSLWKMPSGEELRTFRAHTEGLQGVWSVAFSRNGLLASGSWDKTVKLWNTTSGELIHTLEGHEDTVIAVAFSPDGSRLASASWDKTVKLWNTASGKLICTLNGHTERVESVAFSPDGHVLASAGLDGMVRFWDVAPGDGLPSPKAAWPWGFHLAFSPDGQLLATIGYNGTVQLRDVASGRELHTMVVGGNEVERVAFSPDGARLAGTGFRGTVRLWDVASGSQLLTLRRNKGLALGVAFSPDGNWLASISTVPSGTNIFTGSRLPVQANRIDSSRCPNQGIGVGSSAKREATR